ncbi:hemerythrin domain-containing protein [Streptacidiphilus jiangxiensis]|uniref:Hemerythrin HHE cation binding domain-containing protein n=1 Tax=Streptacidiphilus jiangxiensis TaxID=235985 RepID=A0A1H7KKL4_STRJI|nr:hemerythrin domain-containing protein [Streptacidiphilus jiangxiensis]SEK86545.1 Hemerythrin HHE cation binding domain-containing protein [Streptacidiphilus jiangxiensis]
MVATKEKINFAVMYATHDAFRRDLGRLERAVTAGRAATPEVRAGWENFKRQLHVHHTVEDAELWPRVQRAVAGRPADLALMGEMEAEHAKLDPLLVAVDKAMAVNAPDLPSLVGELSQVLRDHMKHEEESALPLIQEVLTLKDWGAFRGGMAKAQGPKGAAVYIPWIMDGVNNQGREEFLAEMPAPVKVINKLFWESRYQKRKLFGA